MSDRVFVRCSGSLFELPYIENRQFISCPECNGIFKVRKFSNDRQTIPFHKVWIKQGDDMSLRTHYFEQALKPVGLTDKELDCLSNVLSNVLNDGKLLKGLFKNKQHDINAVKRAMDKINRIRR
jgi:hypothetical protein